MTGDGLRFAVRGGELAAETALRALANGWPGLHDRLAERRRQEFESKQRFNRAIRAFVGSQIAVRAATAGAFVLQPVLRSLIVRAGDCDLCRNHPDDKH